MRSKNLTKSAAAAAGIAAAATMVIAAAPMASADTGASNSAYALAANGLVQIPAVSQVASSHALMDKSLISVPHNPLINAKVLHSTAGAGFARASVADVDALEHQLSAHVITAKCVNGEGVVNIASARLGKERLAVTPAPNSALTAPLGSLGGAQVILNKQVRNADGSLSVTAIEVNLKLAGKTQTIDIASATCAANGANPSPSQSAQPTPSQSPTTPATNGNGGGGTGTGTAPAPKPVAGNLPVTG